MQGITGLDKLSSFGVLNTDLLLLLTSEALDAETLDKHSLA